MALQAGSCPVHELGQWGELWGGDAESQNHKIIEYQVGRDLKDHLVQPFLAKAQSRQEGPAPCPAEA